MHPDLAHACVCQALGLCDDSASQGPKRKTHPLFSLIFFGIHIDASWVCALRLVFLGSRAGVALARGIGATAAGVGCNFKPKSSAWQRCVRTRHQSTLNRRPMATTICLRLDLVVLGWVSIGSHLATGL